VWGLAAVLFLYVAAGGLRAVAEVAVLQCVLRAAGALIIGGLALHEVGGWSALARDLGLAAGTVTDLAPDGSSQDVTQLASGGAFVLYRTTSDQVGSKAQGNP
jgi:Na+/proline symporter